MYDSLSHFLGPGPGESNLLIYNKAIPVYKVDVNALKSFTPGRNTDSLVKKMHQLIVRLTGALSKKIASTARFDSTSRWKATGWPSAGGVT